MKSYSLDNSDISKEIARLSASVSPSILRTLNEISTEILHGQDVKDILHKIIDSAIRLINADAGVIYLLNEDQSQIAHSIGYAKSNHPFPRLALKNSITNRIINTAKPICISNIKRSAYVNPVLRSTFNSLIGLPIRRGNVVIGVLYVNCMESRNFSESDQLLLNILSSLAGISIEKSLLIKNVFADNITIEFTSSRWGHLTPIEYALSAKLGREYIIEKNANRILVKLETPAHFQAALDAVIPVLVALEIFLRR